MRELSEFDLAIRLGAALAIGLVVGVERGWRERDASAGSRTAGVRTYALSGLLGGICGALAGAMQNALLVGFCFIGFAFVFALFKLRESVHDDEFSVTGVIAALAVFLLGAYAVLGDVRVASGVGAAVAVMLASRELLHGFLAKLTWVELRSALLILGMSAIVLPLLPDRAVDPFGSLNPHEIWLFAILIATISYVGYIALRLFPPHHGIALAAMTGAVVSSTATTLDLARRSQSTERIIGLAGGASLAAMVSALRVLLVVALLQSSLASMVAPAVLMIALVFGLAGLGMLWRSSQAEDARMEPGNPFDLPAVLGFAALLAVVSLAAHAALRWYGSGGLLTAAAIASVADVDAAVLAAIRLSSAATSEATAAHAILLAVAINALARNAYAFALGRRSFALLFGSVTLGALAAGLSVHMAVRFS